jgi:hypothetical protein
VRVVTPAGTGQPFGFIKAFLKLRTELIVEIAGSDDQDRSLDANGARTDERCTAGGAAG